MSVFGLAMPQPPPKRRVQKWEYKSATLDLSPYGFKVYGEEGWELVCETKGAAAKGGRYIFKRPLP